MWKVPLFDLNYCTKEETAVQEVLNSRWLTMGEKTQQFEAEFAVMLGQENDGSVAVSSATAALHMALLALGVGVGDEVIVPALTFVADANVVKMVGATPVFADSTSLEDWNVSANSIEAKITAKTKAVIAVHFAGYPCNISSIVRLCKSKNIGVIEDVAHAPGASHGNSKCGTVADIGCFSFFSNKNLSVGEGGMVVSNDSELVKNLTALRSHGMTTLTLDRHKGRAISYDVSQVGLNYRMDEIRAALGIVQLGKLEAGNLKRMELTGLYNSLLKETDIAVPFEHVPLSDNNSYHIMPVFLPDGCDREYVISQMRASGVQTSIHYPPFWSFTAYQDIASDTDAPIVAVIGERELTLPLYPTMTEEQVQYVVSCLLEAIA